MREPFCGWSHRCGMVLSIAGLLVLAFLSWHKSWHLVGFLIYGVSLITLGGSACQFVRMLVFVAPMR